MYRGIAVGNQDNKEEKMRRALIGEVEHDVPYLHLGIRRSEDPNGYVDPLLFLPAPAAPSAAPAPTPPATPVPSSAPAPPASAGAASPPVASAPAAPAAATAAASIAAP